MRRGYDRDGALYLASSFDRGRNLSDDYSFRPDELLRFDGSILTGEFKDCCQRKADEWLSNGKQLDCVFLLFGSEEAAPRIRKTKDCFAAFKITADRDAALQRASVRIECLSRYQPSAIGDASAVAAIATDEALRELIKLSMQRADPTDSELDQWFTLNEPSRTKDVEKRLIDIVEALDVGSIGGKLTVASGRCNEPLTLRFVE